MEIKRNRYLERLINHKHNGLIKVITGIRRCGKSYLLFKLFKKHLTEQGVEQSHIIEIALDDRKYKELRDPDACYKYVTGLITDLDMYYILLDEVQLMHEFEDVLNGFLHLKNIDVYVTGSNSKFLSSDIITEFRGRGDEIHIYPLSFSEFYTMYEEDWDDAWKKYYTFGGLPLVVLLQTAEEKTSYLVNLFKETYIKDIVERNQIRNDSELEELINVVSSSIGSLTNPQKLTDTFKSKKSISISPPTVKQYLDYLQDAFIIDKAMRYDIKGKRYINTPSKYYFTDIGLRNARLGFRQQEENHIMENIIFNELKVRGFLVDVGVVDILEKKDDGKYAAKQVEVDFVANQGSKRYYIQSAFALPADEKKIQEERPLLGIKDSFKKIIVVKDNIMLKRSDNGVVTMGIKDFLFNQDSLEL
jgi:uncharacterized protein